MLSHEAAGAPLVPAKRKNLPNRILRAFDNAMHIKGLPLRARSALAELCRFVSQQRPFESIFAHKKTLAERSGMSERTLFRQLAVLEDRQLIDVLDQERKSRNGRFAVARIRLTPLAAALTGLIDAPQLLPEPDDAPEITGSPAPKIAPDAPVQAADSPLIHSPPSAILSARQTLTEPTSAKHQPPALPKNGVPADLAWLSSNGVSRAGIFKLMGMARACAKRLSDIATVVRERLQDVKGGHLFAYLAKLITGPSDFSCAAAAERRRVADIALAAVAECKKRQFRHRFRRATLTNLQQNCLYVIDADALFVQTIGGPRPGSMPLHDPTAFIALIDTGQLVLASSDLERQFGYRY